MRNILQNLAVLKFTLLVAIIVITHETRAQVYNSSQYMNNLTPVNAAYSLLREGGSLTTSIKKQWINLPGSPTNFNLEAQTTIPSMGAATGITISDYSLAIEHLTEVNAFVAKSIQLSEKYKLGVAINAGIKRYVANYSSIDSTDPLFVNDINQNSPNVGFSVMLYSDNFYVGLSMPKFSIKSLGTASIDNPYYLKNHYNIAAACLLDISQGVVFKPSALITYVSGAPIKSDLAGTFYFNRAIGMGMNYRSNSKMSGMLSFVFNSFKVGYSYQFGAISSNLGGSGFSTHELALTYNFGGRSSKDNLL
jgi:type IX secretion system PorP/SprF family membrane protein